MKHAIVWHTPRPLWTAALLDAAPTRFRRPELLRFASDTFMEDLQKVLDEAPSTLTDYVARDETWRTENVGWLPETAENDSEAYDLNTVVKLYQPAHMRYYLVAASLVCQVRTLPDRAVDTGEDEKVSFVVRRLIEGAEYGWFGNAGWKAIDGANGLDHEGADGKVEIEERLPLFAMSIPVENAAASLAELARKAVRNGRAGGKDVLAVENVARKLFTGFIPVANRERYEAAPREGAAAPETPEDDPLSDVRFTVFEATVLQALIQLSNLILTSPDSVSAEAARDVIVFALLDLAEFLEEHLPDVWKSLQEGYWTGTSDAEEIVFDDLNTKNILDRTWRDAILDFATGDARASLLAGDTAAVLPVGAGGISDSDLAQVRTDIQSLGLKDGGAFRDDVATALAALEPLDPSDVTGVPQAVEAGAGATYAIRCVYERPRCACFDVAPIVSAPTQPFHLASYFDPEAPARPLRVTLPIDTSVGGFRKAAKGVSFLMSKQLREQIERVKQTKFDDLIKQDVGEGPSLSIGMICSFSIPIITICAIILLIIMVEILHIIFRWIPFFRICFPLRLSQSQ